MNKYVSLDKRSKKAQREYHAKQRRTWSELNPVTRSVPSVKTYNRKKEKQRIGKEFTENIDKMGGEETAEFTNRAIQIYCG